jgi:hypothetical protein
MAKFRHFEESRIHLGVGELHIQEVDDGVHISISEEIDHSIRIGIPDEHGTSYNYWRDIVKKLKQDDDLELATDIIELEEETDEKKERIAKRIRPQFVSYSHEGSDWIGIKIVTPEGDPILITWEKGSNVPIPLVTFNLDLIKIAKSIGQSLFYQELKKVCDEIVTDM